MSQRKETDQRSHIQTAGPHSPSFSFFFFFFFLSLFLPSLSVSTISTPQTSNYIMICPLCPNSDVQIFKYSPTFDYQMEGDYSWMVLIMSDRLLNADTYTNMTQHLSKLPDCGVYIKVLSFNLLKKKLQSSGSKENKTKHPLAKKVSFCPASSVQPEGTHGLITESFFPFGLYVTPLYIQHCARETENLLWKLK